MKILFIIAALLLLSVSPRGIEDWKDRVLYQIVTDRFGRSDGAEPECKDLLDYCGGTFKGIENNLDYIQGLGATAIWISPVQKNGPKGYHGYHYQNIYEINPHFGTKQDFKDLVEACHQRGMLVMVDTVPNHVAPVPDLDDFSHIVPFNKKEHYHWPIQDCNDLFLSHSTNQTALEFCWLWGLPDLNHEHEFVRKTLIDWIHGFIQEYNVDGLRLDAVRHVPKWFWEEFQEAAGVFTMGEVFNEDIEYVGKYQKIIDSLLNFPLQERLNASFHDGKSMLKLADYYHDAAPLYPNPNVLGNFVNNHDLPRFLNKNPDIPAFKAFYAFSFCATGIPSIYYGDEQLFDGDIDPENRETLWGKMDTKSEMYQFLRTILEFRKRTQFYKHEQIESLADEDFYAFYRGHYYFAFTNQVEEQSRTITNHPFPDGTVLCNLLKPKDCLQVEKGVFQVSLEGKEVLILHPQNEEAGPPGISMLNSINNALVSGLSIFSPSRVPFMKETK